MCYIFLQISKLVLFANIYYQWNNTALIALRQDCCSPHMACLCEPWHT